MWTDEVTQDLLPYFPLQTPIQIPKLWLDPEIEELNKCRLNTETKQVVSEHKVMLCMHQPGYVNCDSYDALCVSFLSSQFLLLTFS